MGKLGKRKRQQERVAFETAKILKVSIDTGIQLDNEDLEDMISTEDLVTTLSVLETLASNPKLLKSKEVKPLRASIYAIHKSNGPDGSLTNQVSNALTDQRWTDARVLLAEMSIRREVPKLGALQRWVRECDAATVNDETWDPEVFQVLEAILRTTNPEEQGRVLKKQESWHVGTPDGTPIFDEWENGKLYSPELVAPIKESFRLLHHIPAAERRPANMHDALLYTSTPNALPFSSGTIVKHTTPFLPSVFLLTDVLTPALCRSIITAASVMGFTPDLPVGSQSSILAHNFYWLADDIFINTLFNLTKPFLPQSYPDGAQLYGINARFRCYRYVPGAVYRPHIDGAWPPSAIDEKGDYVYDASPKGTAVMSRLTFLIYLNDEFEGGETTFYKPCRDGGLEMWPVKPRCGGVLVFPHGEGGGGGLLHEGTGVKKGGKFVIRTDVLYSVKTA